MALSLYELKRQYHDVLELEVGSKEDADAMIALLDEAEDEIEVKIAKIGHVIVTLDYEAKAIREEEKVLAERRRVRENKIARLKSYLYDTMKDVGLEKVEQIDRTVRIQKNPPSLKILDESAIPAEYWVPQDPKLDLASLKEWVKGHPDECDFAYLDQTESVRVK